MKNKKYEIENGLNPPKELRKKLSESNVLKTKKRNEKLNNPKNSNK